jgi:hypothetical protein
LFVVLTVATAGTALGAVDLELRPSSQTVQIGDTFDLGLYAVSDSGSDEPVGQIRAVLSWNASFLELLGVDNNGPYAWLFSGFPSDNKQDGLNDTFEDGNALYEALGQFGTPALATPAGLLVTTLEFRAIQTTTGTAVTIPAQIGSTQTVVFDAPPPSGEDVTGSLGFATVAVVCFGPADCDDANPCTDDECSAFLCEHVPNDANEPDDGLYCNGVEDFCLDGSIVYQIPPPDCDDSLICTADSCDEDQDTCVNQLMSGRCLIDGVCYTLGQLNPSNDCQVCNSTVDPMAWSFRPSGATCGDPANTDCNNPDTCDGAGTCQANHEPDGSACTDDGNDCTDDVCASGTCTHPPTPAGTACGDTTDTECTDPDTCDGMGQCLGNHVPDASPCDDGLFCTIDSDCQSGLCVGTGDPCPNQVCDEFTDQCKAVDLRWSPIQQSVLVGGDAEINLRAVSGIGTDLPFNAVGVIFSWDPSRLELLGNVDNGPYAWVTSGFPADCGLDALNSPCSGLPANDGNAYYEAVGQFQPSNPAVATVSGLEITTLRFRTLLPGKTEVQFVLMFGDFTITQVIDAEIPGLNTLGALGAAASVNVLECVTNAQCDDGLYCNGAETCVNNFCAEGAYPCGTQYCRESDDACVDCLTDFHCDDGFFCTGTESCDQGTCLPGTDPCPDELCDDQLDACVECLSAADCEDNIACTLNTCQVGACVFVPNDASCDNGVFCDGFEVCEPSSGCVSPGNPCPEPDTCEEFSGTCGGCHQPAVQDVGSRYLAVTTPIEPAPVAIWVVGHPDDPDVSCMGAYVQDDGTLGPEPVFHDAAVWGTVLVHGLEIRPGKRYRVHTDCGIPEDSLLSAATQKRTWAFGDVNNSGDADVDDILLLLDAVSEVVPPEDIPRFDLFPCEPDGVVDVDDLVAALDAAANLPFLCPRVCFPPCSAPAVAAEGCRYLSVVLQEPDDDPVAIAVTADCAGGPTRYASAPVAPFNIAPLVTNPNQAAFLPPSQWGSPVYVTGELIAPSTPYRIQTDCGGPMDPVLSDPAFAETWVWGDTNLTDFADVDDLICIVFAFAQDFSLCPVYAADLALCDPDGTIDVDDIVAIVLAYGFMPPYCPAACP